MSISSPPNGGYVPPGPSARRSGPGCWVWGFMTCLVVFVVIAGTFAFGLYKISKTKQGRQFFGSLGSAFKSTESVTMCIKKMTAVRAALVRYHDHTGHYPQNLKALVPDYLGDPSTLHCPEVDSDPAPAHVSFGYIRPADNAPGSTPVLSFHWKYSLMLDNKKTTVDTESIMLLNGTTEQNQAQTVVTGGPGATHSTTTTTTKIPSGASASTGTTIKN